MSAGQAAERRIDLALFTAPRALQFCDGQGLLTGNWSMLANKSCDARIKASHKVGWSLQSVVASAALCSDKRLQAVKMGLHLCSVSNMYNKLTCYCVGDPMI